MDAMDIALDDLATPREATAWLLTGPGAPPLVCVGSHDTGGATHVEIASRGGRAYDGARRISFGGAAIPAGVAAGSGDHSYSGQAGSHAFEGRQDADGSNRAGAVVRDLDLGDYRTSVWQVRTPQGMALFVAIHVDAETPADVRSMGADALEQLGQWFRGPCSAMRVDAAQFTALEGTAFPTMPLILAPR